MYDVTFDNVQVSHRNGVRLFFCKDIKFINGCTFTKTKDNKTVKATDEDLSAVMENSYEATYTWNKGSSSIGSITTDGLSDTPVYTLAGLYVANPSKGLYISNGKKFINK